MSNFSSSRLLEMEKYPIVNPKDGECDLPSAEVESEEEGIALPPERLRQMAVAVGAYRNFKVWELQ